MNVAIVGSRDFGNDNGYTMRRMIVQFIDTLPAGTVIVSGGARGVDRVAESWAKHRRLPTSIFPADWDTYGKSAGFRRNAYIIGVADIVVVFLDGVSRGTAHSIGLAKAQGKPLYIVHPGDPLPVIAELERG
jgi:predicted Rossmann fold nucleotide-binding protein DprA/Smf involved in DNA uptake